jgi:hypothetical protein
MKVSMGMNVALNPNPPDIRISMDIHGFTYYSLYTGLLGLYVF